MWNSYKDTLHTSLYRSTLERLKLGEGLDASHELKKKMTQQELIAKRIPGISDDEIAGLNIPTGIPLAYELDSDYLPVRRGGRYLDPQAAVEAAEAVKNQGR